MLGNTFTLTLGGSGGTEKILNRISDDGYSAEYLLRESTQEFRVKITHSNSGSRERHFVEVKQTIYATSADKADTVRTVSNVLLVKPGDVIADVTDLQEALSYFLIGVTTGNLMGWRS